MAGMPPGSYLALSHPAKDIDAEAMAKMADSLNKMMAEKVNFRDRPAVARFFEGLELVEPGMVQASKWRPATDAEAASPAALWAGVARKTLPLPPAFTPKPTLFRPLSPGRALRRPGGRPARPRR